MGCSSHNLPQNTEKNLAISFPENSWALSWEQMKELARFRSHLDSGETVSLEVCVASAGDKGYFPRNRAQSVKYFLISGNPLDVELSLCYSPDPERQRNVYVSVVDTI